MSSQQIESSIKLAHPGKRFQGQFIDGLVSYLLGIIVFYVSDFFISREPAVYFGFAVGFLYFLLSDALPNGQSVGKRLLNIRVIHKETKLPCSLFQSFLRNATFPLGILDWALIFFGAHRRLGDVIASTIVVKNDSKST
ncbi:RDD family protein [Methylophilus sp. Q8]|uniref:RDD family protein n=1 Tax=Methylophilus sp. Q8 TaxID=1506586 RepID=UPI000648C5FD|nr:RDD family protein [Methylophilus sp. Q8]